VNSNPIYCCLCGKVCLCFRWMYCVFCDAIMCEGCEKSTEFGHTCNRCFEKVKDGRIDENGVEK
jgi:hypothetical protein